MISTLEFGQLAQYIYKDSKTVRLLSNRIYPKTILAEQFAPSLLNDHIDEIGLDQSIQFEHIEHIVFSLDYRLRSQRPEPGDQRLPPNDRADQMAM